MELSTSVSFQRTFGYLILSFLFIAFLVLLSGCGGEASEPEPEINEEERITNILTAGTGTWTPSATNGVTLASIDLTDEFFSEFTIRFTQTQLFTTGTSPVWLREDAWRFKAGSFTILIRGQDNKEIIIESISETELRLSLDWTETTYGGRANSLPGKYVFSLKK